VFVLFVLLAITVITHVPLILVGGLVVLFVVSRHRRSARGRNWSRSGC
jgi:hypothetical protein